MTTLDKGRKAWYLAMLADYIGMMLVLAALIVFFSVSTERFWDWRTFLSIANQIPPAIVIAVGMTLVLIIAAIDLSVGSVLALSGAVLGVCMVRYEMSPSVAVVACVCVGLACGLANGLVTVGWGLPSFIVTLGMLEIARGGAYLVANSQTQYIGGSIGELARPVALGLSQPFFIALAIVAVGQFVLSRTVLGRYMIAIGTNEEAVRLSGIDPRPVKLAVFSLCGLLSGLAAVFQTARFEASDPNAGIGAELQAIAAVVIGGTSLMGGRGSVVNSFFGVVIIAVLSAGLAQMGAQEPTKRLITGCVIVAAVVLDHYRCRLWKA